MSKLIAFVGSPRKKGISTKLMEQIIAGAESAGAEVKTYNLNNENIKGCQACFYCRGNEGCAVKDDLQPMYEDIINADGVIASFPIYFHGISGQSKLWLDRLFPMMNSDFSPRHPGKKFVSIYTQGNPDKEKFQHAIDSTNSSFKMFGWDIVSNLIAAGTNIPGYEVPQELLEQAFEIGKQLA